MAKHSEEWREGFEALVDGKAMCDTPYRGSTWRWIDWRRGWLEAQSRKRQDSPLTASPGKTECQAG